MKLSLKDIFMARIKDASSAWYGTLVCMLCPVVEQDIYDVGQFTADMEKLTNLGYGYELWERPKLEG